MADVRDNVCSTVILRSIWDTFTKYETVRSVSFHSPIVGICNRLIQGTVIAYVIVIVFLFGQGYQLQEEGESSVVAKIIGLQRNLLKKIPVALINATTETETLALTWDSVDTVVPALENNALFITTKVMATPRQLHGICPEDRDLGANCETNADCTAGHSVHIGHGHMTGTCNTTTGTCDVHAWCPIEKELPERTIKLRGGQNLTILLKNYILFPKYKIRRRNIGELDEDYVTSCFYNVRTDPLCPAFKLGYIIEQAGEDYKEMAETGAVLGFSIKWDCNLDYHIRHCVPTYTFLRIDEKHGRSFPGWNYRRSGYWEDNGRHYRYLLKHTGIRIIFNVDAVARKFNFVIFTMNLGSGLGLLGTATLICDFVLYHCAQRKTTELRSQAATLLVDDTTMNEKLKDID